MYEYLKGIITKITAKYIVLEANGIGYILHVANPYNCPHGRPVLVNFTKSDMEKMFCRIQENHTSLRELGKY